MIAEFRLHKCQKTFKCKDDSDMISRKYLRTVAQTDDDFFSSHT